MGTWRKGVFTNSVGKSSRAAVLRKNNVFKHILKLKVCILFAPEFNFLESNYRNNSINIKYYVY